MGTRTHWLCLAALCLCVVACQRDFSLDTGRTADVVESDELVLPSEPESESMQRGVAASEGDDTRETLPAEQPEPSELLPTTAPLGGNGPQSVPAMAPLDEAPSELAPDEPLPRKEQGNRDAGLGPGDAAPPIECPGGQIPSDLVEGECIDEVPLLRSLRVEGDARLAPIFVPELGLYAVELGLWTREITITATSLSPRASIWLGGVEMDSGVPTVVPVEGQQTLVVEVTLPGDSPMAYELSLQRPTPSYIKALNPAVSNEFGRRLAMDGDTLVVSSYFENTSNTGISTTAAVSSGAPNSGAVYVYVFRDEEWQPQAYIKPHNTGRDDLFGYSLAVSGDTLVVAAPWEGGGGRGQDPPDDNAAPEAGAVYVFVREGNVWSQRAYLKASNAEAGDRFGDHLALQGDTLVVSATGESGDGTVMSDNSLLRSGAVYVFERSDEVWQETAYLKASNADENDRFGTRVAIDGDTLAVGCIYEDGAARGQGGEDNDDAAEAGAVYIFERTEQGWSAPVYLKPHNTQPLAYFGWFVALDGDTLAVTATRDSGAGANAGAAFVFERTVNGWLQRAYLAGHNTGQGDAFGIGLALEGDRLAVSAHLEDGSVTTIDGADDDLAENAGAAYLFVRNGGAWSQHAYLKARNSEAGDEFGGRIALSEGSIASGSFREDGGAAALGGNMLDNSRFNSGAVFVWRGWEGAPSEGEALEGASQ